MSDDFTHIDETGATRMVDVADKADTRRVAVARSKVLLSESTYILLRDKALPKGDALNTAKIAGIMGAKQTHHLIPLCHPLFLSYVDVRFELIESEHALEIEAEARTTGKTGVEMEALMAAQIAAASIYDMCKAVQKDVVIADTRLIFKSGGKSGTFRAE